MSKGWFKLYRGWQENPAFRSDVDKIRWLWLIENAVIEENKVISINNSPVTLTRGQLSYSIRFLAKAWGCNPQSVRTFLKHLKKWHMINTASNTGQCVITICNYCKYQDAQTEPNTPHTLNLTQAQHRPNTNIKNEKNEEEDKREGFSKPSPKTKKNGCRLPEDWGVTSELGHWAMQQGLSRERVLLEEEKFIDYWLAKPGQSGVKLDWNATWRNWVRRVVQDV